MEPPLRANVGAELGSRGGNLLESFLFFGWLVAVAAVILWAAQNDRGQRQNLLSRIFAMTSAAGGLGRATAASPKHRDGRQRARRLPPRG
jgi:hypothetical protein